MGDSTASRRETGLIRSVVWTGCRGQSGVLGLQDVLEVVQ